MSKQTIFTGAGVAIVTPMKADGSVDFELYRELVEDQIQNGTDAIVTCGTTGESSTLDDAEHIAVMKAAVEQAKGRVPVIAGTGSNETAYAVHLSQEAKAMGADALLLVTPYYNKTSQAGLIAHYEKIVNEVKMPSILYNVPSRTGVNINVDTVVELAKNPYVVGIKQANANLASVAEIASRCDIDIYSGNDNEIVAMLALGAKGVISVLSNVIPRETHEICAKWFEGKPDESRDLQLKYLELANTLFCDVNPIPVKEAMNMMGWNVGDVRLPLVGLSDANRAKLRAVLDKYGLLKA